MGSERGCAEVLFPVPEADTLDAPHVPAAVEQGGQRPARLTPRDLLVLMLISRGYGRHQIAHGLQVSVAIVERHLDSAVAALAARDVSDAAARARRRGLIGVPRRSQGIAGIGGAGVADVAGVAE
jgi:DNA-binding NarL/FixJ family response regulator